MADILEAELKPFQPLSADHPLLKQKCPGCNEQFKEGDITTLVPIGPGGDEEARKKAQRQKPYTGVSLPIHWTCLTGQPITAEDLPKPFVLTEEEKFERQYLLEHEDDAIIAEDDREVLRKEWAAMDEARASGDHEAIHEIQRRARLMMSLEMITSPVPGMIGLVLGFAQIYGDTESKRMARVAFEAIRAEKKKMDEEKAAKKKKEPPA